MGRQILFYSVLWVANYQVLRTTGLHSSQKPNLRTWLENWSGPSVPNYATSKLILSRSCLVSTVFQFFSKDWLKGKRNRQSSLTSHKVYKLFFYDAQIFFFLTDSFLSYLQKNLTCPTSVRGGETSELKFLKIFWVKKMKVSVGQGIKVTAFGVVYTLFGWNYVYVHKWN